ncbi:Uncharacterized protein conserved in bacteria [Mycobacteroides abscessus subsp. abscessus]|nr:Uncharacterized protein conserved in bacteria [Mycobacteroides abscessus subsp. abscessus]
MLREGKTYHKIETETGASTATISRVKRCLNYGNDAYEMALERIKDEEAQASGATPLNSIPIKKFLTGTWSGSVNQGRML